MITPGEEDLTESGPEVGVEDSVDDWVEETVDVAEPDNDARQSRRVRGHRVPAERLYERHDEERQPADDERSGHNGQRPRNHPTSSLSQWPMSSPLCALSSVSASHARPPAVITARCSLSSSSSSTAT